MSYMYIRTYKCIHKCITYIYIYIQRERERERDMCECVIFYARARRCLLCFSMLCEGLAVLGEYFMSVRCKDIRELVFECLCGSLWMLLCMFS